MPNLSSKRRGSGKQAVAASATRIVREALRDDVSVGELAGLAEQDPGFASRLLSLVSSPTFGGRPVRSIRQASSLLGIRGLRNLALSLVVTEMAPDGPDGRDLLSVCLRRAVATRLVGARMSFPDLDACFTTGLLLEVGLLRQAQVSLAQAAQIARSPGPERLLLERAAGWEQHTATGVALAEELKLPFDMVSAIQHHHDDACPTTPLARVAWVAEAVAAVFEGGEVGALRRRALEVGDASGLQQTDVEAVLEELPVRVAEGAAAFQKDLGPQPAVADLVRDANRVLVELNQRYSQLIETLEELVEEKEALAKELRQANQTLSEIALTDPLTDIPNKRALTSELDRVLALADREGGSVALVVVDIDHFKRFNDQFGHATGDEVLKTVATALAQTIRTSDFVARFGGEEFVVVLPSTSSGGARILADRLRKAVAAASAPGPSGPLRVTASLGVASVAGPGCKSAAADLFQRADEALYEAKANGRNCVMVNGGTSTHAALPPA